MTWRHTQEIRKLSWRAVRSFISSQLGPVEAGLEISWSQAEAWEWAHSVMLCALVIAMGDHHIKKLSMGVYAYEMAEIGFPGDVKLCSGHRAPQTWPQKRPQKNGKAITSMLETALPHWAEGEQAYDKILLTNLDFLNSISGKLPYCPLIDGKMQITERSKLWRIFYNTFFSNLCLEYMKIDFNPFYWQTWCSY